MAIRVGLTLLIVIVGGVLLALPAAAGENGDPVHGEKLFRACKRCHTVRPNGDNIVGPRLYGLFGRRAGAVADYKYSPALERADFVWTEETLDRLFALGPHRFTPGSKMPLQEMPNPKDRADLIAYLKKVTAPTAASEKPPDD